MDEFRLDPNPPVNRPTLNLYRLKAGEEIFVRCLSAQIFGYWSHWTGKCSMLCKRDQAKCEGCKRQLPTKWKGLLHVINQANGRQMLIELTTSAGLQLADALRENENFRGKRLRFQRSRGGDNGRLRVEVIHEQRPALELPEALDPWPTIAKIFDIERPFDSEP